MVAGGTGNVSVMSKEELVAASHGKNQAMFERLDTSNDGTVSVSEWNAFLETMLKTKAKKGPGKGGAWLQKVLDQLAKYVKKGVKFEGQQGTGGGHAREEQAQESRACESVHHTVEHGRGEASIVS